MTRTRCAGWRPYSASTRARVMPSAMSPTWCHSAMRGGSWIVAAPEPTRTAATARATRHVTAGHGGSHGARLAPEPTRRLGRSGRCAGDALDANAMAAPAGHEPDVGFRAQRALHDRRRRPPVELAGLARRRECAGTGTDPDDLPNFRSALLPPPRYGARSANFAKRFRNESLIESVGPFRCLARCTSASPCWSCRVGVVVLVAVDEHHEVGVLLERPGLAEVGEDRPLVVALLDRARELRQRQDRHVEVAREHLQRARDLRHLLHAVLGVRARGHQLEVVDDDQPEARARASSAGAPSSGSPSS